MLAEVRAAQIVEAIGRYRIGAVSCVEAAELLGMSERHSHMIRHRVEPYMRERRTGELAPKYHLATGTDLRLELAGHH
jgi:hypothetical protein